MATAELDRTWYSRCRISPSGIVIATAPCAECFSTISILGAPIARMDFRSSGDLSYHHPV
jgi:hypothetical protein